MAKLEWRDTTERETGVEYEPCRAVNCGRRNVWEVETCDSSDAVCNFHLATYLWEFVIGGPSAFDGEVRMVYRSARLRRLMAADNPATDRLRTLGIKPGDISHVLRTQ